MHTCRICEKKIKTEASPYIGSHVKRSHGVDLKDYCIQFYTNLTPDVSDCLCNHCGKNTIKGDFVINHIGFTFSRSYKNGYLCDNIECKKSLSLEILGIPYDRCTYQYIGSHAKYLSVKHKIPIEEAKGMKAIQDINIFAKKYKEIPKDQLEIELKKYIERRNDPKNTTSLFGYIERHGEIEGTKKYKERCEKISKSNNLYWYIERFGEKEGSARYNAKIEKIKRGISKNGSCSVVSKKNREYFRI